MNGEKSTGGQTYRDCAERQLHVCVRQPLIEMEGQKRQANGVQERAVTRVSLLCHTDEHTFMSSKRTPRCPVNGCETKRPHNDDPLTKMLVQKFSEPGRWLGWVRDSLGEFRDSMIDDRRRSRVLGWYTRIRQVEELYFRTLYILFLAADEEIPHILSGEPPNSFNSIYQKVNDEILLGVGNLSDGRYTLLYGQFTPMELINSGAHVDFRTMLLNAQKSLHFVDIESYLRHVHVYINRIEEMRKLFEAGKDKLTVQKRIAKSHKREAEARPQQETKTPRRGHHHKK